MTLAAELARLLAERNVTGYRLAPMLGTQPGHVHRWLTGRRGMTAYSLGRVAKALDLSDQEIARLVKAAAEGEG